MAGFKNGKIMLPIKEFLVVKGQATYELNGITDMSKVTVFYRKFNEQAYLETYTEMPKGYYRINETAGNKQLEITNLDILNEYYSIQLARLVDLTSSIYEPSGAIDVITLNQHLNEAIKDIQFLFEYIKNVGMVIDSSQGNKILSELLPNTTWFMDQDGNMATLPVNELFDKLNILVEKLRAEVLKLLEQDLSEAEIELLEKAKQQLDEYTETILKQRLNDYTTQLEERLQIMVDQAVADKGLMPEGKDWFNLEFGNYLVTDIFNKNYINIPTNLNTDDNNGVVKVNIVDEGRTQVIRYYTTTGKMFFAVKTNEVWSEWQELGGQTDSMQFTQANHGFVFTAVTLDGTTRQWKKATKDTGADAIAIRIDNDRFDVVIRGIVNIPTQARDDKGNPFVYDEYYFLSQNVAGGLARDKSSIGTFQSLIHVSELDGKQVAYIDVGTPTSLDYEVLDKETAQRIGIATDDDINALDEKITENTDNINKNYELIESNTGLPFDPNIRDISDVGTKVKDICYLFEGEIYKCLVNTDATTPESDKFQPISNNKLSDRLDNLEEYEWVDIISRHQCLSINSSLRRVGNTGIVFLGINNNVPITSEFVVIGKLAYNNHDPVEYLNGSLNIRIADGNVMVRCSDNSVKFGWVAILSLPILFKL